MTKEAPRVRVWRTGSRFHRCVGHVVDGPLWRVEFRGGDVAYCYQNELLDPDDKLRVVTVRRNPDTKEIERY